MELLYIRVASLIVIALIYMLFDIFNKRNIPSGFIYFSLAYGIVLTILYLNLTTTLFSAAIAAIVLAGGYLIYKAGQLGAADVVEFAALSLILPMQITPFLDKIPQFNLPFIISLLVNTGISAFVVAVLYYLPKAKATSKKPLLSSITTMDAAKAIGLAAAYIAFLVVLIHLFGFYLPGVSLLALLIVVSVLIILFEKPITATMVSYVDYKRFEAGDIIAMNMMSSKDIASARRKVKGFGGLITDRIIKEMKEKHIATKFPVYKSAMPLALPIFIGVCLSLLFGDLLLFIKPFATSLIA